MGRGPAGKEGTAIGRGAEHGLPSDPPVREAVRGALTSSPEDPEDKAPAVCRDPSDDSLLGCAAAGDANYLVTGDGNLLAVGRYGGVTILTAREFLALLAA